MAIPFFTADAARVTILRPLASSAFGSYNLTLPEGIDLEDVHDFEAPSNELGHVSTLTRTRRVGGLARRFIRADVAVTSIDPSDPDRIPESNVDAVLTEAALRVSSEFFLESDVSKAGLGAWIPFVDFNVGDKGHVEVYGHVVTLPITRIEPIISDHDVVDWRVHLGGQLVSNEDAREVENETLRKAFIQDRRELAGIETTAKNAEKTADSAKSTADTAKTTADDALAAATDADGVIQGYITEGRGHVADALAGAELASEHVSTAQTLVEEAEALVDEAEVLNDDIKSTFQQMQLLRQQATKSVRVASGQAAQAIVHAGEAHRFVEQARSYNTQIAAYLVDAQDAVEEGREHADAAARSVSAASRSAGEAQTALTGATNLLADVDGEGTDFPTAITQVVTAHNDVLLKHQVVITKHGEAITSATNAATSAGNAAKANTDAIKAMNAANGARDTAITKAADAAGDAGKAAKSLSDAVTKVIEAQGILEENQAIQTEINTKHGQAIKAAARAAGQASMAAMQANETARSAALAADSALDAIDAMEEAQDARDQTIAEVAEYSWLANFRRVRILSYDRGSSSGSMGMSHLWENYDQMLHAYVEPDHVRLVKVGGWSGTVKISAMTSQSKYFVDTTLWHLGTSGQEGFQMDFGGGLWDRIVIEVHPTFLNTQDRTFFRNKASTFRELM